MKYKHLNQFNEVQIVFKHIIRHIKVNLKCACVFLCGCWLVMLPAAVTQQNHHPAEEGKLSDLDAMTMKMQRLMCTVIFSNNSTTHYTVESMCEKVKKELMEYGRQYQVNLFDDLFQYKLYCLNMLSFSVVFISFSNSFTFVYLFFVIRFKI